MELNKSKILLLMAERGYNMRTLSDKAELGRDTLNKWLNHGTKPRLDKIGKLAKVLGVSVEQIIIMD